MKNILSIIGLVFALAAFAPVLVLAAPPANDAFDSPTVLSGFPVTANGTNVDATLEPDEPLPVSRWWEDAAASVWFRWTSPTTGPVQIDTLGSDFDTMLAVWRGNELISLELLADNAQFGGGGQSAVFISASADVTYQIAVYGWSASRGLITLNITNDVTSKISGTVTGPDGTTPLQGIEATAYQWTGSWWEWFNSGYTDANGEYTIGGLPAGTYRVQFEDWQNGDYLTEVYDNAPDLDSGTDIVVPAETTVTGIDASLASIAPPAPPRIVALRQVADNDWEILHIGTVGREYILQETSSLTNSWDDVGTSFVCQPDTNTISRQSSAPTIFWRIREFP